MTATEIQIKAENLLREAGLEGEVPVPLEKAARHLGYSCVGFTPTQANDLVSGVIDYDHKTIYVNLNETVNRQRFTLAHEIGHAVLHPGQGIVDLRASIDLPPTPKETEANQFAAALLMPADRFCKEWDRWNGDLDMLGAIFGASAISLKIRAKSVGVTVPA